MNKYELFLELQRYPALLEELSKYKLQKALHQCRMMIDELENEKFTRLEPFITMSNVKEERKTISDPYDAKIRKLKEWGHKIDSKLTTNSIDEKLSSLDEKYNFSGKVDKVDKIIDLATDGRKVQRKHKKHAKEFMRSYSEIKKDTPPGISIEGFIEKVGMTEVSTNTYREWIEKFDKAEEMLPNDD